MITNQTLGIIVLLWFGSLVTALAEHNQDELKQRILTQAQSISPEDYAFTRTVHTEQTSNGKTEKEVSVEKFDPTEPVETRWMLVSVNGAPPSTDALKNFAKESAQRRVPGYYRLGGYFGTPATTSTDSLGRTVFRFATLPKETVKVMGSDVSQNTASEASVSEANGVAFVEQVHLFVKPMRLKLIIKLEKYESTARYRLGQDGKPLLIEQTSDVFGSGMGQQGRSHSVATYSDYRAVRNRQ
jgi:hypothetical protein